MMVFIEFSCLRGQIQGFNYGAVRINKKSVVSYMVLPTVSFLPSYGNSSQ